MPLQVFSHCTRKQTDGSENSEDSEVPHNIPSTSKQNKYNMEHRYDQPFNDGDNLQKQKPAHQFLKESSTDDSYIDQTLYNERVYTVEPEEIVITQPDYADPTNPSHTRLSEKPMQHDGKKHGSVNIIEGHVNPSFTMESPDNETGESVFSTNL